MKLSDVPKGSKFLLIIGKGKREGKEEMCTFRHIDGMYSYITTEDKSVVHLSASVEVKLVGNHYELV